MKKFISNGVKFGPFTSVDETSTAYVCDGIVYPISVIGSVEILDGTWDEEVDLTAIKLAKNLQINKWREEANRSTFMYNGKEFAIDALSRSDFDGVANNIALKGTFPEGFPNAWKAVDNSYIALPTIAAFSDLYAAMTATGSANFAKAQQLKAALAAATTLEQVEAIVWD